MSVVLWFRLSFNKERHVWVRCTQGEGFSRSPGEGSEADNRGHGLSFSWKAMPGLSLYVVSRCRNAYLCPVLGLTRENQYWAR